MKKITALFLSLAMVLTMTGLSLTASATSVILDVSKGNVILSVYGVNGYDVAGNEVSGIYNDYIITGSSNNQYSIDVQSGTHRITLQDLSITCTNVTSGSPTPYICPIKLASGVVVQFNMVGSTLLKSGYNYASISVPSGAEATFGGNGSISISSGQYGAGIGGSSGSEGGKITINSGDFNIIGGYNAAGIGGSMSKKGGTVIINGGTITTTGGNYGSGIGGGGGDGAGGTVTINGGSVTAIGGATSGTGIGGGNGGTGGSLTVTGGTVYAKGGSNAAGIGSSGGSTGGVVSISGGTVTAIGGSSAPGIGGGGNNGAGGTVNITGGFIKATTGSQTRDNHAEAIGRGGYNNGTTPKSSGTRNFGAAANLYAGSNESSATYVSTYTGQPYLNIIFNVFNLEDGPIYISATGFRRASDSAEVSYIGEYVLTGSSENHVVIESGTQMITLRDLHINTDKCAFSLSAGAAANVTLEGNNSLKSGYGKAGLNIPHNASISIQGGQTVCAVTGGADAAGIGGNQGEDAGSITISDGTITATGGTGAAAIGGGNGGSGGAVVIKGGSVKAIPGIGADVIGGGYDKLGTGTLKNDTEPIYLVLKPNCVLGNATRLYTGSVDGLRYSYRGYGHGNGDTNLYFYLPQGYSADRILLERVGSYPDQLTCNFLPFTDDANTNIISFKNEVVHAGVKILNDTGYDRPAVFIMAAYNDSIFIGNSMVSNNTLIKDGDEIILTSSIDMSDPKYEMATRIKVFVWDGFDSINPLLDYQELTNYKPREYIFGTLQNTRNNFQANYDAGMNMGYFALQWGSFYTSEGVLNTAYIQERKQYLQQLRDTGFEIMLGFGTQYPPNWIYDYPNSRFVNQYGDQYSTTESGNLAVNAVFNDTMRQKIAQYVHDVFAEFGTDFDIIRLGWMRYGEIGYPGQSFNGKTNSYWAFDPYAQGQLTGLPDGIPICPVPGWIPGTASTNHENARKFAEWYMNALLNYQSWQVDLVSSYSNAELAILYPSWGMREGQLENAINGDLSGKTPPETNGEVQRGFDFKRLIMGITNPKAIVYCTWIDANPAWTNGDDQTVPTPSNNFSPVHYMAYYAKANPLHLKIMGENTGGGGLSAMALTFARMKLYDLDGLMWAFESDLYDGIAPVLADYKNFIKDYIGTEE